ncbi:membrane protein E11 [Vespertilionid gammaherpesvirus 1]|uniref:Membrane protein E11 n=1 Tax=Vespertilionid gammaherpesvirus 1 TaxID=2560830 RepID=A0A0X9XGS6_9GAMA|nr:membrane protein E11 [Myotis gammaherpesvirus 8]AMA67355.1 membrane protein E11 [Vespertilionid gammaherpesvirus 1]
MDIHATHMDSGLIHISKLLYILAVVQSYCAQVVTQDEATPLGDPVSIKCFLETPQEVVIVTWQKVKASSPENMATFSNDHGVVVQPAYKDKMNITELGLQNTTITFWNTTLDDEGCYKCLFNTFGSGKMSGIGCLTLFVPSRASISYELSEGSLNVTCSANARPVPTMVWNFNDTDSYNNTEIITHPNGTTSIVSVLYIRDPKNKVEDGVICEVNHLNKVELLTCQPYYKPFWFSIPSFIWAAALFTIFIIIILVFLLCKFIMMRIH